MRSALPCRTPPGPAQTLGNCTNPPQFGQFWPGWPAGWPWAHAEDEGGLPARTAAGAPRRKPSRHLVTWRGVVVLCGWMRSAPAFGLVSVLSRLSVCRLSLSGWAVGRLIRSAAGSLPGCAEALDARAISGRSLSPLGSCVPVPWPWMWAIAHQRTAALARSPRRRSDARLRRVCPRSTKPLGAR